jgi:NAD-dependent SIR2 family protein deacetylase
MVKDCDAVVLGAGAGLSTAAGYTYAGPRFMRYFSDFAAAYGIEDMYTGGFYPFPSEEEYWGWWSRHSWVNRYNPLPSSLYGELLRVVSGRPHFVLTTNVDACFERAGFAPERIFATQGDYGRWQCSRPCQQVTYSNHEALVAMLQAQGFGVETNGELTGAPATRAIPRELVPRCPNCGAPLVQHLRQDERFVEDASWHAACERYQDFLNCHASERLLLLELGVGGNTPGIIKYPFWRLAATLPHAVYACVNQGEAFLPRELAPLAARGQAVAINASAAPVIRTLAAALA